MNVLNIVKRFGKNTSEYCVKHSDTLCTIAAVGTSLFAFGTAIKATNDIQEELEIHRSNIGSIKESYDADNQVFYHDDVIRENKEIVDIKTTEITGEDALKQYKKDLVKEYGATALTVTKYYILPVTLEAFSIFTIITSNKISRKRNAELSAGLAAVQAMYDRYRQNVIAEFGEEKDRDLRLGIHREKTDVVTVDENGNEKTKKGEAEIQNPDTVADIWCRCFDESNDNWSKDYMVNRNFLFAQQAALNNMLRAKKYMTFNEACEALDLPQSELGQTWGWVYDRDICVQIDLGIKDITNERKRAFVNGDERNIFIDWKIPPYYIGDKVWGKIGKGIATSKYNYI